MTDPTATDVLRTLLHRYDIVASLKQGRWDKRKLQQELEVSRSTIDRTFRMLEENGVLTSRGSRYQFTLFGALLVEEIQTIKTTTDALIAARPALRNLPATAEIPCNVLESSEPLLPTNVAPHAPLLRLEEEIARSEDVRAVITRVLPKHIDSVSSHLQNGSLSTELVMDEEVLGHVRSSYLEQLERCLGSENFTLWRVPETPPFGLALFDERAVWLSVYSTDGQFCGGLYTEDATSIEWAAERYGQCRARGVTVTSVREKV